MRTPREQVPLFSDLRLSEDPPQVRVEPSGHKIEWERGTGKKRKALKKRKAGTRLRDAGS